MKEILEAIFTILYRLVMQNSLNYDKAAEKKLIKLKKLIDELPDEDK